MTIEKKSFVMPRVIWTSIKKMQESGVITLEKANEILNAVINYGFTGELPPSYQDARLKTDVWDYGFDLMKNLIDVENQSKEEKWVYTTPAKEWKPGKITCEPLPYKPTTGDDSTWKSPFVYNTKIDGEPPSAFYTKEK